ncbi:MAG: 23S rRNA (guanosine(2251)-2'-O)-methyltransferase RlmB [Candidatus Tectomicrobia bacterium]|nr:23S rRNA (guanosine(2251)-2'-O)-methyltransferase RlmB [Candidatus Tectomicrobia bacterium]
MAAQRLRPEEVLYGRKPVLEALRAGQPRLTRLLVARSLHGPQRQELEVLAAERGLPLEGCSRAALDRLLDRLLDRPAGERPGGGQPLTHQGIVALREATTYSTCEAMLEAARAAGQAPLLVVLDAVEDPRNLGAVIRSLAVLGAHGLLLPRHHAPLLGGTVAKAAAGLLERLPVARVVNVAESLRQLQEAGLWVIGAAAEAETRCDGVDLAGPLAIVIGGEAKGLRPLVRRTCDQLVRIPAAGVQAPLNLSVAASILIYEVQRQRQARPGDRSGVAQRAEKGQRVGGWYPLAP